MPPPVPAVLPRAQPQIGGSFGGFIALVVCLVLVILVSSTAVFILLRRNVSNSDRSARRNRRKYQHSALPTTTSSEFDYSPSSKSNKSSGPFSKLRRLLGLGSPHGGSSIQRSRTPTYIRGRNGSGWQQADSGDEWDVDVPSFSNISHEQPVVRNGYKEFTDVSARPASIQPQSMPSEVKGYSPSASRAPPSNLSGLQTQLPASGDNQESGVGPRVDSPEPLSGFSTTDGSSPATNSTPGTTSKSGTGRTNSSGVASFAGGTKFIEDI